MTATMRVRTMVMSFEWIRCLEDTLGFLILMSILHALKMKKRSLFFNRLDVYYSFGITCEIFFCCNFSCSLI